MFSIQDNKIIAGVTEHLHQRWGRETQKTAQQWFLPARSVLFKSIKLILPLCHTPSAAGFYCLFRVPDQDDPPSRG